jgi:hypothetical protein
VAVTDRKVGARPIGSTTTKRVTVAEMKNSSGIGLPVVILSRSRVVAFAGGYGRSWIGSTHKSKLLMFLTLIRVCREPPRVAFATQIGYLKA